MISLKNPTTIVLTTKPSSDYELLDSGDGEKLERFGKIVLSRPDPQALWHKRLSDIEWKKAEGYFGKDSNTGAGLRGDWNLKKTIPDRWEISFANLKFYVKPTAFKHVGIFPEQEPNWDWMREKIRSKRQETRGKKESREVVHDEIEILNLFAYTGGATIACAQAGAKVVHVDGSKVALTWARENAELSGLKDKPIRWILDDVRAFVKREIKRGRKYHGIIMDPPAFGHGAEKEVWKIEDDFMDLIESCMEILADKPLFFLVNGYSAGYSAIAYKNNLLPLKDRFGGEIEVGELTLEESMTESVKGRVGEVRFLPCGIFARWAV